MMQVELGKSKEKNKGKESKRKNGIS